MLFEINRGLHPIKDVRLTYWISIPTDHLQFKSYRERFDTEVPDILDRLNNEEDVPGIVGGRSDVGRNWEAFNFDGSSPLAPIKETEGLPYLIFHYGEVELQFYKQPISLSDHPRLSDNWDRTPDLKLSAGSSLEVSRGAEHSHHSIGYEVATKEFEINAHGVRSDPRFWESTGKVVGISDLLGTQVFVLLPSVMRSGDPVIDQYLPELRKRFHLRSLNISMSDGREIWLSEREGLTKHVDKDGYPMYVFTFPESMPELAALSR